MARYTLSVKDAAAQLGLSVHTIYRLAERGAIDHLRTTTNLRTRIVNGQPVQYRKHGRLKFSQAGLDAWVAQHRAPMRIADGRVTRPQPPAALPLVEKRRFG